MTPQALIKPVAISAYSALSNCGYGSAALLQALLANKSYLGALSLFPLAFETLVGEIQAALPIIDPKLEKYHCRNARVALAVLNHPEDGVRDRLGKLIKDFGSHRIGVVIGTSTSGLYESEAAYALLNQSGYMPEDFNFVTRHAFQATARFLQLELQLSGPCYAISTACSSSAKALAVGQRLIGSEVCDAVLVGGIDTLCRLTLRGFKSLDLISAKACQPMDVARSGINIGEAGVLMVLERSDAANRECPHLLAVGESSDAHHMSTPHPEGMGAVQAMQSALEMASLTAEAIDYLNLHATATRINDEIEAQAVKSVLPETACSATKGITGHTLGAAGALESLIALLALQHQFLPGTANMNQPDPLCPPGLLIEPQTGMSVDYAMSNSFGFGGNNASVILSRMHG